MGIIFSFFPSYKPIALTSPPLVEEKQRYVEDLNAKLANQLKGQIMHVDMTTSFQRWPMGARHPEYERLRQETDRVLEL